MSASGRSPRVLTVLSDQSIPDAEIASDLYRELSEVNPVVAAHTDPQALNELVMALEEEAPDGWPFGVNTEGNYGFWPLGDLYWSHDSIFHDVPY